MRRSCPGGYARRSRSSRTASMPRLLAASISTRSRVVPSRIETHASHAVAGVAVLQIGAVERLGQDPGKGRLAGAAGSDEEDRVAHAFCADTIAKRLDDRVLADDLGERLRSPAAIQRLVRDRVRHHHLPSMASKVEMPCTLRRAGRPRAHRDGRLGPGRAAALGDDRLVLLPSGSDTVRGSPLRGTRSSTSHRRAAFGSGDLGRGFSPAGADCRYRAPLVPRLARLGKDNRGRQRPAGRRRHRRSACGARGGGEGGIRTRDGLPQTAFPVRRHSPLGDLSPTGASLHGRSVPDRRSGGRGQGGEEHENERTRWCVSERADAPTPASAEPDERLVAERAGFEPAVLSHTAFRERHHQPLGHLSAGEDTKPSPSDRAAPVRQRGGRPSRTGPRPHRGGCR